MIAISEKRAYAQARNNMVQNQIIPQDVGNPDILKAMTEIPRHLFVARKWEPVAYVDDEIYMNSEHKLMRPEFFARMVQALQVQKNDTILDINCGTGYSTCILSSLGEKVVGVENDNTLIAKAESISKKLGIKELQFQEILPIQERFDVIVVNSRAVKAKDEWLGLLKPHGRLALVEECGGASKAVLYKNNDDDFWREILFDAYVSRV